MRRRTRGGILDLLLAILEGLAGLLIDRAIHEWGRGARRENVRLRAAISAFVMAVAEHEPAQAAFDEDCAEAFTLLCDIHNEDD